MLVCVSPLLRRIQYLRALSYLLIAHSHEIFPRLVAFKPDMLFISAGFDGHRKDTINGGYLALVSTPFTHPVENHTIHTP
jgi:acetoin utilization deacetylase AcuC-like enzyme